ncbi:MAG: Hint domain-containing protein [Parasphingorhabdus sp.]|uniref:Hint domain-containing protein n=1 Tax=Parasphingorhabdus sp. TaxID=2709688 RepID=UPI003299CBE7
MATVTTADILLQEINILPSGKYNFVSNTGFVTFTEEDATDIVEEQSFANALYSRLTGSPPDEAPEIDNASLFSDIDSTESGGGTEYVTFEGVNYNYQYLGTETFPVNPTDPGGATEDLFAIIIIENPDDGERTAYAINLTNSGDPDNGSTGVSAGDLDPTYLYINEGGIFPCFTVNSLITTIDGECAIETLKSGDLVLTKDDGMMPVLWVGRRKLDKRALQIRPNLRPILFKENALGKGTPVRGMMVSPQHRMLLQTWSAELLFGENEVLSPAKFMTNDCTIMVNHDVEEVEYVHILFDTHQIVKVDGVWSESFHPGEMTLTSMDESSREEVFAIFPELKIDLKQYGSSARPSLKAHEVRALLN